jgi:hypothetical protein
LPKVNRVRGFKPVGKPVDDTSVKIVAAEVGVAVGCTDFDDAIANFKDGDVEGAPTEVVDGNSTFATTVETVRKGRGGRLIYDPQDLEAGDTPGVTGRLPLRI